MTILHLVSPRGFALCVAFTLTLFTTAASAQGRRVEIGAYGGYLFGGSATGESPTLTSTASIESAPSYGAFLDWELYRGGFAELSYTRQPTEVSVRQSDGSAYRYDLLVQYAQIGGLLEYHARGADWIRPIFGGTIGATIYSADDDSGIAYEEWRLSLLFEGGVKIRLLEHLGLRFQGRVLTTFLTDEAALFCLGNAGCVLAYTGTAVLQGEVAAGAYLSF